MPYSHLNFLPQKAPKPAYLFSVDRNIGYLFSSQWRGSTREGDLSYCQGIFDGGGSHNVTITVREKALANLDVTITSRENFLSNSLSQLYNHTIRWYLRINHYSRVARRYGRAVTRCDRLNN